MYFAKTTLASTVIALGACSTSSEPTIAPQIAQPGDIVGPGSSFATQDAKRFVLVNGTSGLRDQTIQWSRSDDGQTMYIVQNHKTFALNWVPSAADPKLGTYQGSNSFYVNTVVLSDVVRAAYFSHSEGTGYYNSGHFVVGYKTDPIEVTRQPGTATFTGYAFLDANTPTLFGFGGGPAALTADFDSGTVTGTMHISDSGDASATMIVPNTTVTINPGNIPNIHGNQFNADLAFSFVPAPGDMASVNQSGLNGAFYGVNAASVGATFWATGSFNGESLNVQGALASN